jgi:4-hydroxybenzoate polyprenyltransferase
LDASTPTLLAEAPRVGRVAAIFDLSRGRQALMSVAQPALGAVIALGALPSITKVLLGLIAASTGFLAVFSLNDVLDRRADADALAIGLAEPDGYDLDVAYVRHPLARGELSMRAATLWVGGLAVVSIVTAAMLSPVCLLFFAAAVGLEILYCALRSVTWAKTFVSGIMVGVGGLAGWVAVADLSARAVPFFAFLALWEIAGRNLPNDLADLVADGRTGLKTVATVFGPKVSAAVTLAGAVATLAMIAFLPMPVVALALSLAAGIAVMGVPALALVRTATSSQAGAYFNRASTLPVFVFAAMLAAIVVAR